LDSRALRCDGSANDDGPSTADVITDFDVLVVEEDAAGRDVDDDERAYGVALFQAQNFFGVGQPHDGDTPIDVWVPDRLLDPESGNLRALEDAVLGLSSRSRDWRERRGRNRLWSDRCDLDGRGWR
jgi:hypothetical protein